MAVVNNLPVTSGTKLDVLWENPNPNTTFGAQNITFSTALSNYEYFMIDSKGALSGTLSSVSTKVVMPTNFIYGIMASGGTYGVRQVTPISTGIRIENSRVGSTGSIDNSYNIPLKIYGIKKLNI